MKNEELVDKFFHLKSERIELHKKSKDIKNSWMDLYPQYEEMLNNLHKDRIIVFDFDGNHALTCIGNCIRCPFLETTMIPSHPSPSFESECSIPKTDLSKMWDNRKNS